MTLRRRLVQHAGAGAGFLCIASSLLFDEVRTGFLTILGILLIPGVPIVVERRRMLAGRKD